MAVSVLMPKWRGFTRCWRWVVRLADGGKENKASPIQKARITLGHQSSPLPLQPMASSTTTTTSVGAGSLPNPTAPSDAVATFARLMLIKLKSADDRFSFRAVAQRVQVRRKGQPVDGLYYVHLMHLDSDGGAWQSAVDIYPDWLMITPRRVYRFAGLRVDFEIDGKIVPYATLTAYMQQLKQAQRRGEAIPEKSFRDVQLFTEGMELAIGVDPAALLYFASKMEELAEDGSDVEVATTMHFVAIWEAIDMSPGVDAEHTLEISARTVATFDESEKITRTEGGRKRSVAGRPILAFEGGYVSVRDHPGVKREQAQAAKKTPHRPLPERDHRPDGTSGTRNDL
ncbi:hypothetical protein U1Q18_051979 [Sarracenia purpurea var. burkii]